MTANIQLMKTPTIPCVDPQTELIDDETNDEFYRLTSIRQSELEKQALNQYKRYAKITTQKFLKSNLTDDSIQTLLTELVALCENVFDRDQFGKYGLQRKLLVIQELIKMFPSEAPTKQFVETMVVGHVEQILKKQNRKQLKQIFDNVFGFIARGSNILNGCFK